MSNPSPESQEFKQLIDAGRYANLNDLSFFQADFEKSEGYRQFCSQLMHFTKLF